MSSASPADGAAPIILPSEVEDEITSINAIYGDGTLSVHHDSLLDVSSLSDDPPAICLVLAPPASHPLHPTTLLLSFPRAYPSESCVVLGPGSVDAALGVGGGRRAADLARKALQDVAVPDEPNVFSLLSELEERIHANARILSDGIDKNPGNLIASSRASLAKVVHTFESSSHLLSQSREDPLRFPLEAWTLSEPFEMQRSVFLARAVRVTSSAEVAEATASLLALDRQVSRATHNMRAWRIRSERPIGGETCSGSSWANWEHQESDDDGEARAGARILAVMSAMDVWNVLLIVSRWYGGTKLGPARFRLIGQTVRSVLVRMQSDGNRTVEKAVDSSRLKTKN